MRQREREADLVGRDVGVVSLLEEGGAESRRAGSEGRAGDAGGVHCCGGRGGGDEIEGGNLSMASLLLPGELEVAKLGDGKGRAVGLAYFQIT